MEDLNKQSKSELDAQEFQAVQHPEEAEVKMQKVTIPSSNEEIRAVQKTEVEAPKEKKSFKSYLAYADKVVNDFTGFGFYKDFFLLFKTLFSYTPSQVLYLKRFSLNSLLNFLVIKIFFGALFYLVLTTRLINSVVSSFLGTGIGFNLRLFYTPLILGFISSIIMGFIIFGYNRYYSVKINLFNILDRVVKIQSPLFFVYLIAWIFVFIYPLLGVFLVMIASLATYVYFICDILIVSNQSDKKVDAFGIILLSVTLYTLLMFIIHYTAISGFAFALFN